mmetsp:Transcript_18005/g.33372  ORF Transcript_18005/g.33372 Transcript_18005/m.33372 type:complete len:792 (-) Transcript_18005:116-2491(-)
MASVSSSSMLPPKPGGNGSNNRTQPRLESSISISKTTTVTVTSSSPNVTMNTATNRDGGTFRKQLGCRRRSKGDMVSPSANDGNNTDWDDTIEPNRVEEFRRKLIFTSPRVISSDEELFPANHSPYKKSEERWQQISKIAGSHRQDGTFINVGRKLTPMALRIGMTKQAADRVRCLNLWLDHEKDTLPEWLDVVGEVFCNLEHLTLTEDLFPGEDDTAVSARMRRLYVLYRLPHLKSIDDIAVTPEERRLALPNESNPNGNKLIKSKYSNLLDDTRDCDNAISDPEESFAHETPVELVRSNRSALVGNCDWQYCPEDDGKDEDGNEDDKQDHDMGRIPRIPDVSCRSGRTATEIGVEINHELATKFAELTQNRTTTTSSETSTFDLDDTFDDDELAGEAMLNDLADSSNEEGVDMVLSDEVSQKEWGEDAGIAGLSSVQSQDTSFTHHGDAVEVDISGRVKQRVQSKNNKSNKKLPTCDDASDIRKGAQDQGPLDDTLDLVSVASTDVEWSAACGVLSFRSDRACAPRLRIPFCSRNRKIVASDNAARAIFQAKANLRNKQRKEETKTGMPCPPVPRNSAASTPQAGCCNIMLDGSSKTMFFPARNSGVKNRPRDSLPVSANKQLPPSQSLSSPFPMQFRERRKVPPKPSLIVKTSESADSIKKSPTNSKSLEMETISSPLQAVNSTITSPRNAGPKRMKAASKGDLPPQCPSGPRRKVSLATSRKRKSKGNIREMKASKENARSTSVMDLDDEDDEEDDDDDVEDEASPEQDRDSPTHSSGVESLTYSET